MAEEELMFCMEEVGNVKDVCAKSRVSFEHPNASDDEEDEFCICPITDDPIIPTKGTCDYQNIQNKQLSNSVPKNSFSYKVGLTK